MTTLRVTKTMPEPAIEDDGEGGEAQPPPPLNRLDILLVEDEAATLRQRHGSSRVSAIG